MPITADFHMHSSHSGDSSTPMEQMIQQAIQTGMTQMCFTEHQDFDYPSSDEIPADYFLLNIICGRLINGRIIGRFKRAY